jgi:hypothetical protein
MRPEKKRKVKKLFVFAVKSSIAALLLYLLLRKAQYGVFAQNFRGIVWWWVIAAASLHIPGYIFSAYRWRLLLKAQGLNPSLWELIRSYVTATFFNYVLLGTLGGDVSRVYDTGARTRKGAEAVSAVLLERVTGVAAMMFLAVVGIIVLLIGPERPSGSPFWSVEAALVICLVISAILFGVLLVLFHPRMARTVAAKLDRPTPFLGKARKILLSLDSAVSVYRANRVPIYRNLFWAAILQVNVTLHYFFLGLAMGLPLLRHPLYYFWSYMVIVPAITLILTIPLTPGGAGVREWTLRELRGGLGFAATPSGLAGALLLGWVQVATVLFFGIIGFLMFMHRIFYATRSRPQALQTPGASGLLSKTTNSPIETTP